MITEHLSNLVGCQDVDSEVVTVYKTVVIKFCQLYVSKVRWLDYYGRKTVIYQLLGDHYNALYIDLKDGIGSDTLRDNRSHIHKDR